MYTQIVHVQQIQSEQEIVMGKVAQLREEKSYFLSNADESTNMIDWYSEHVSTCNWIFEQNKLFVYDADNNLVAYSEIGSGEVLKVSSLILASMFEKSLAN